MAQAQDRFDQNGEWDPVPRGFAESYSRVSVSGRQGERRRSMRDGTKLSLGERLQYALALVPAAQWEGRVGRSPKQLRRYIEGADPPFSVLTMLSVASGVPLEWLATGRGDISFGVPGAETKADAAANPAENAAETTVTPAERPCVPDFGVPARKSEEPPRPDAPRGIFHQVDPERLSRAYQAALNGIVTAAGRQPDPRRIMQVTILLYDEMTEAEAASKEAP